MGQFSSIVYVFKLKSNFALTVEKSGLSHEEDSLNVDQDIGKKFGGRNNLSHNANFQLCTFTLKFC